MTRKRKPTHTANTTHNTTPQHTKPYDGTPSPREVPGEKKPKTGGLVKGLGDFGRGSGEELTCRLLTQYDCVQKADGAPAREHTGGRPDARILRNAGGRLSSPRA